MTEQQFKAAVARAIKIAIASIEGAREVITAARAEVHLEKRRNREKREKRLGAKQIALPKRKYGVIVADPEWQFRFRSELGKTNSSPIGAVGLWRARHEPRSPGVWPDHAPSAAISHCVAGRA
jgi:hypothetical protein